MRQASDHFKDIWNTSHSKNSRGTSLAADAAQAARALIMTPPAKEAARKAGTCTVARRQHHQLLLTWLSHGVLRDSLRDEPCTVLLDIFSMLSVIDKASLEKCELQKGCGCLQG